MPSDLLHLVKVLLIKKKLFNDGTESILINFVLWRVIFSAIFCLQNQFFGLAGVIASEFLFDLLPYFLSITLKCQTTLPLGISYKMLNAVWSLSHCYVGILSKMKT